MDTRFIQSEPAAIRHGSGIVANPIAVFFERFLPLRETGRPTILMVHGGAHSGSCWLLTADGRPGWAYDLAHRGYGCVVPDWPGVGRSGAIPIDEHSFQTICAGLGSLLAGIEGPVVLLTHSMGGPIGWRLAEQHRDRVAAVVAIAPGPPGNIQPQPEIVGQSADGIELQTPHRRFRVPAAGPAVNDAAFIDGKLIGASTQFPAESRALYGASLLHLSSSLIRQRTNLDGAQLRVEDPARLAGLPVLVVTGTGDLEHPYETDAAIVDWLNENGASAELVWLADRGITGNGHMIMLERNGAAVSALIGDWLDTVAAPG